jgi:hypothetical protein
LDKSIQSADLSDSLSITRLEIGDRLNVLGPITTSSIDATGSSVGGALTVPGGAGIAKQLYVGGGTYLQSTADASSTSQGGALTISGGASIAKQLFVGSSATVLSTLDASSSSVGGALTVAGGASFGMHLVNGFTVILSA